MRIPILAALLVSATPAAATAQGRWKEIGKTAANNSVFIDPKSVATRAGIVTARIQVKFIEPVKTPRGDWRLSRHVAMFDCTKKSVAAKSSTYYADAAGTKVVETKVIAQPGFGPAIGGSMTQVALDYVCRK